MTNPKSINPEMPLTNRLVMGIHKWLFPDFHFSFTLLLENVVGNDRWRTAPIHKDINLDQFTNKELSGIIGRQVLAGFVPNNELPVFVEIPLQKGSTLNFYPDFTFNDQIGRPRNFPDVELKPGSIIIGSAAVSHCTGKPTLPVTTNNSHRRLLIFFSKYDEFLKK